MSFFQSLDAIVRTKTRARTTNETGHLHLKLGIENLHVQPVLGNLLLANSLRLGFVSFFIPQGHDLMVLRQALDELGFDISRCLLYAMCMRTHSTRGTASGETCIGDVGTFELSLAGEHHKPLVMFLGILLLELASFLERDVCVLHSAQVRATVSFNNDKITSLDLEAGVFLEVEHVGTVALEGDDVQKLVLMGMGQA